MPTISPARKAAYDILFAVERGKGHSDDLLHSNAVTALSPADRNLATTLVLGTLRWQIQLDAQIKPFLKRPNAKLDVEIRIALRLGAYQILQLTRIPTHAAIDESVELTKQAGHRFASGMVNAVLRKLAQAEAEMPSPVKAHPAWMVQRWKNFYGTESTDRICQHGQRQPAATIRIPQPKVKVELAESGIQLESSELLTDASFVLTGDVTATEAFQSGAVRFQDEGSQLIAELVGGGEKILDCCAAPGGKTLVLAERNPQAKILACEISEPRFAALRQRLNKYHDRIECRCADASSLQEEAIFDRILADVPCSGTGTLGRNPEIRHRLQLEDLPRQAERQRTILLSALRTLRTGGRLMYSTCSLEPEENEQVIEAVLAAVGNVRVLSLHGNIAMLRQCGILTEAAEEHLTQRLSPQGYLRLFPGSFTTDGFFLAQLEKFS